MTTYSDYRKQVYAPPTQVEIDLWRQWAEAEAKAEAEVKEIAMDLGGLMGIEARNAWIDTLPDGVGWSGLLPHFQDKLAEFPLEECRCVLPEQFCSVCAAAPKTDYFENDIPFWIGDL